MPKSGRPGHVEPGDVTEAAPTAGLSQTSSISAAKDWSGIRLVTPKAARPAPLTRGLHGPLKGGRPTRRAATWGHDLSVGDRAPDFSLPDQDKQVVSLADLRGTPVLLVFYPFAFSGICTGELCQLRDELADLHRCRRAGARGQHRPGLQPQGLHASRRATSSRCCRTSGRTAPSPRPTACSTRRPAWPCVARSSSTPTGTVAFAEVNQPGDAREQSGWKDAVAKLARLIGWPGARGTYPGRAGRVAQR